MSEKAFPLLYKSGIKRDGTKFQPDYCTDGQWIRFHYGKTKKIGGMYGLNMLNTAPVNTIYLQNFFVSSTQVAGSKNCFFINLPAGQIRIVRSTFTDIAITQRRDMSESFANNNYIFQFEPIIRNAQRQLVVFAGPNAVNISQSNTAAVVYSGNIDADAAFTAVAGLNPLGNGGVCYASPYLFLYGANGFVAYSRPTDPLLFTGEGSGILNPVSSDKVIYAREIRGGSNSPSLLFWTMSSVVRISNVGDVAVNFKSDTIFKGSSILSSRCVVEFDGLFFWPGTDRFYVYNGIVNDLENNINIEYFFNNLDLSKRQAVFGMKNPKNKEIWWFYPETGQAATVGSTRALIYNLADNSWSDTAIRRSAGFFFTDEGQMYTTGLPLVNSDNREYFWRHETINPNQIWTPEGAALRQDPIPSSFTTPPFSWYAFNPLKQMTGTNKWVTLKWIEPDFLMDNNEAIINLVVNSKEYAQSPVVSSAAFPIQRTTTKQDIDIQGRNLFFTFSSTANFEMGHITLMLTMGDGQ